MLNIDCFSPDGYFGSNTYVIAHNGEWAVIDPSVDSSVVFERYPEMRERVRYILLTHCHFDHILKIDSWTSESVTVVIGADDAEGLSDPQRNCYLGFLGVRDGYLGEYKTVKDGDVIDLGGATIRVIGCPGHTPGGVSYRIFDNIFVGDTVFEKGGYGRCDLPGGNIDELEKTLIRLFTHEKDAVLYPGHGGSTTLSESLKYFM